jgi:hypothetical protein
MFYDKASLALKIMDLEAKAAETHKTDGKPTQAAMNAQAQIDRLANGSSRIRIKPSNYRETSTNYQPGSGAQYWSSVHEMLARSFEAYVAAKVEAAGGTNEFITKGDRAYLSDADRRLKMTFPKGGERDTIFAAWDDVMHHVRNNQLLGSDPAAARPADVDILDPQYLQRQVLDMGEPGVLDSIKSDMIRIRNVFERRANMTWRESLKHSAAHFALRAGVNPSEGARHALTQIGRHIKDATFFIAGSARATTNAIIKRNPADARGFLTFVTSKFQTNLGTGTEQTQTYEEAREQPTLKAANDIADLLKVNGFGNDLLTAGERWVLGDSARNATK